MVRIMVRMDLLSGNELAQHPTGLAGVRRGGAPAPGCAGACGGAARPARAARAGSRVLDGCVYAYAPSRALRSAHVDGRCVMVLQREQ